MLSPSCGRVCGTLGAPHATLQSKVKMHAAGPHFGIAGVLLLSSIVKLLQNKNLWWKMHRPPVVRRAEEGVLQTTQKMASPEVLALSSRLCGASTATFFVRFLAA